MCIVATIHTIFCLNHYSNYLYKKFHEGKYINTVIQYVLGECIQRDYENT